jgi:hypothetical protein
LTHLGTDERDPAVANCAGAHDPTGPSTQRPSWSSIPDHIPKLSTVLDDTFALLSVVVDPRIRGKFMDPRVSFRVIWVRRDEDGERVAHVAADQFSAGLVDQHECTCRARGELRFPSVRFRHTTRFVKLMEGL